MNDQPTRAIDYDDPITVPHVGKQEQYDDVLEFLQAGPLRHRNEAVERMEKIDRMGSEAVREPVVSLVAEAAAGA